MCSSDLVAGASSSLERETPKVKAADPPSEPAKAAVVAEKDAVTPSEASPLVVDLQSRDANVGDAATSNAFEVVPRAGAGGGDGSFPLPSSAVVETAKDSAMTLAVSSLPGPHLATLEDTPPYSGPTPSELDTSGHFPLAVLMEKRAKDQLEDARRWSTPLATSPKKSPCLSGSSTLPKVSYGSPAGSGLDVCVLFFDSLVCR